MFATVPLCICDSTNLYIVDTVILCMIAGGVVSHTLQVGKASIYMYMCVHNYMCRLQYNEGVIAVSSPTVCAGCTWPVLPSIPAQLRYIPQQLLY